MQFQDLPWSETLSTAELARLLRVQADTIARWRNRARNGQPDRFPPYIKDGRSIKYPVSWLTLWLAMRGSEVEPRRPGPKPAYQAMAIDTYRARCWHAARDI